MHRENIERVANEALANAKISIEDVDAIAVTNRPGALITLAHKRHILQKISINFFLNFILKIINLFLSFHCRFR